MKYFLTLSISLLASCMLQNNGLPRIHNPIRYPVPQVESMVEGHRSVTGKVSLPRPMDEYDATHVVITTSSGETIEARWPAWEKAIYWRNLLNIEQRRSLWAQMSSRFDPSREYHVELLTRIYGSRIPGTGFSGIFNDILRVSTKEQTIIDTSICQVHRLPMERVVLEACSSEDYPSSFFPLQKKKFPNDGNEYLGCDSGPRDINWKCAECNRLYRACIKRTGWGD